MKKNEVVKSSARIVAQSGMMIAGKILDNAEARKLANSMPVSIARPRNVVDEGDAIVAAIGKMCAGSSTYESMRDFNGDPEFYQDAPGVEKTISPERLRQRLGQNAEGERSGLYPNHSEAREMNLSILLKNNVKTSPLPCGLAPVDCDVTPYGESHSHKEGVSRTCKNHDGYAHMDAHIGLEGYFPDTEFREGKQHCRKGTPNFLAEAIDLANRLTGRELLFRLDSGNDPAENLGLIMERGHRFIVKRSLRKESKEDRLALAEQCSPVHDHPREGKARHVGSSWKDVSYIGMDGEDKTTTVRIVYEVVERTIDKKNRLLLVPDIEADTWRDNTGLPDEEVMELCRKHGTMEQFHSELKSEMDMERLPSGKFATNRLVHGLSMLAYNVLRILGDMLCDIDEVPMRAKAGRRRLRAVISNIIRTPARAITSGRRLRVDVGSSNPWPDVFIALNSMIQAA